MSNSRPFDCSGSLSQAEQLELRETTQLGPSTRISRIRSSKPTMNLRLRGMRGQGRGSLWGSNQAEGGSGSKETLWHVINSFLAYQRHRLI